MISILEDDDVELIKRNYFCMYCTCICVLFSGMRVDHANIVETDIAASNGVIHAIDHIIFPSDLLSQLTSALN